VGDKEQGESMETEPESDRNVLGHGESERLQQQKAKKKHKEQAWKDSKQSEWQAHIQENGRHRLLVIRGPSCAFEDCVRQGSANLQHCARCKVMCYCSREHQMADWRIRHKGKCDALWDQALACGFVDSMTGAAPELEVPRGV
jgi:hypothetical protein